MGVSQALAIEELLEGRGFAKKSASLGLLSGLGARLTRAIDPTRGRRRARGRGPG